MSRPESLNEVFERDAANRKRRNILITLDDSTPDVQFQDDRDFAALASAAAPNFDPSLADQPGMDPREEVLSEVVASALSEHSIPGASTIAEAGQVIDYSIDDLTDPVDPDNDKRGEHDKPLPGQYAQQMTDQWYAEHPELDPNNPQLPQPSNDQYGA